MGALDQPHAYACRPEEICIPAGIGHVLSSPPLFFLSIWSTPRLLFMGALDQPHAYTCRGVRRYAFRQERYPLPPPPTLPSLSFIRPSPSHSLIGAPSFLDGDPCICMSPRGTYAFRQERYPLPPHLFLLSFIRPSPSHSLIGAPSFLDGDPCICMSPRGTYAFREEKYPYPCTHMPPVERYASPNKTCPILPPHFLGPLHLGPLHLSFL